MSFIDASVTDMFLCVQKIARKTLDCINVLSIECTLYSSCAENRKADYEQHFLTFVNTLHFRFCTLSFILNVLCVHINA